MVPFAMITRRTWVQTASILMLAAGVAFTADHAFTSYASVKPVLDAAQDAAAQDAAARDRLPADLKNPDQAKWTAWSRRQDQAIRARLEQGDLDSMVNLLLLGASFTKQPRVRMENLAEASKSGLLRARVDDLVAGLRNPGDNDRLVFLRDLLQRSGIDAGTSDGQQKAGVFLLGNVQRVAQERRTIAERAGAKRLPNQDQASVLDRASLFADRGVSLDTNILPNFSIEETLRDLKTRGVLREGRVTRVAVVGPGLDFIDKNEESSYDYYPQQTLQPFALVDSLLRLRLAPDSAPARGNPVWMSVFDISARVIDHIQRARERARRNIGYVIQLPHDVTRVWPPGLLAYWNSLGDRVGTAVAPIRPPEIFQGLRGGQGLETRAVEVRPVVVLACDPVDLNIVLERMPLAPADGFDLIVGTNIFVYYDSFEQSLALENAGAMLKPGGLLLTNDRLPEVPGGSMRLAGTTVVRSGRPYSAILDAVGWYQKR